MQAGGARCRATDVQVRHDMGTRHGSVRLLVMRRRKSGVELIGSPASGESVLNDMLGFFNNERKNDE